MVLKQIEVRLLMMKNSVEDFIISEAFLFPIEELSADLSLQFNDGVSHHLDYYTNLSFLLFNEGKSVLFCLSEDYHSNSGV